MAETSRAAEGGDTPPSLRQQRGADGSFSLYSTRFGEGFHGPIGALTEARLKFVEPAELRRFKPGAQLLVVDVAFGLGTNSAALLEAARPMGLLLSIHGLELDAAPLRTALAAEAFRRQWDPTTLAMLDRLLRDGRWRDADHDATLHWGDARCRLATLLDQLQLAGRCDLVLHDAFSPQRCPELWSLEFLTKLARLLRPEGRLLTYCSAAAVRHSLRQAGLQLASIRPLGRPGGHHPGPDRPITWSHGTAASPTSLSISEALTALTPMELDHLTTRAAEPYRDPDGHLPATAILAARQLAQAGSPAPSTSAWRRRWGLNHTA